IPRLRPSHPTPPDHPSRSDPTIWKIISLGVLTVACFVFALSGSPGWVIYSIASGVLFATTMALASAAFSQHQRWVDLGGLIQRVALTIGWTWQTLLAARILHT
ncbi:hypothetical protein ACFY3M_53820, partial [Streptomyces mirabilis]|uniref:hypothetical protein n=1 Tax=Streptomyces mirabilis TaxID=68239 RepID=UPI003679FFAB